MTVCHHAAPLPVPSLNAALGTLRAHGLRISTARRLVLAALFAAERPITAEEVAGGLDGRLPVSDLASVYRNLETLEALGVVRHVHVGHAAGRYTIAGPDETGYAACERCGRHVALDRAALAAIRTALDDACGFAPALAHFPILGTCPDCAGDR